MNLVATSSRPSVDGAQAVMRGHMLYVARRRYGIAIALALVCLGYPAMRVHAQGATGGSASAGSLVQVQAVQPLSVVSTALIRFGHTSAVSGAIQVATSSAYAGQFYIEGASGVGYQMTLTLPTSLSDGAGHTIPIGSFTLAGTAGTAADPAIPIVAPMSFTLPSGSPARSYFRLGATTGAFSGQSYGTYTATISISVAYP